MNIELEEVAVQDVSDEALELAAGGALAQGGAQIGEGGPHRAVSWLLSYRGC